MACSHDWSNNAGSSTGAFCNHCGLVSLSAGSPGPVYTATPMRQSVNHSVQPSPVGRSIAKRFFGSLARGIEQ